MTMSPAEIERKVRQLDNDVQSIYTMLSAIQGTQERHTNRLFELAEKVDSLEGKLTTVDGKVDTLAGKLTTVDGKVDSLEGKLTTVDGKVDTVLELLRAGPANSSA